jgi:hypothetical protein
MNSSNCFSCVPSCPPVCEDRHKVSSPADQKLPLPRSDEEMVKVLENLEIDEVNFYYPFLTPKILALTGKDEWEEGRWLQPGSSVYGLVVYLLLDRSTPDFCSFFLIFFNALQQTIAIGMVQGYILYWLWQSLPATYEADLCSTSNLLFYVCIIGVFVTSLVPGLLVISHELKIIKSGTHFFLADSVSASFDKFDRSKLGAALAYLVVLYELLIWAAVLLVGINYILSAETLGDLVQAAVAITFISDLDDMAVFLYGPLAKLIETTYVRCDKPVLDLNASFTFSALFTIPVIVSVSFGIIYGIHNSYC